jgi:hypothetical protein
MKIVRQSLWAFICACVCFAMPFGANGQDRDPTFNGLANIISCPTEMTVACNGDFCFDARNGGTTFLVFDLAQHRAGRFVPTKGIYTIGPIEVLEASPATVNAPLSVLFRYGKAPNPIANASLALLPLNTGKYDIRFGSVVQVNKTNSGPLPVDKVIWAGRCNLTDFFLSGSPWLPPQ